MLTARRSGNWHRWMAAGAILAAAACGPPAGADRLALVGATLIDGTGAAPVRNAIVIVHGATIEAAGPAGQVSVPKGAEEIDLAGRWILPGFIDADVRAEAWALPRYLAFGVTAVRDLGTATDSIQDLAQQTSINLIIGPRIYYSGTPIGVPGSGSGSLASSAAVRRAVDQLSVAGTDYIMIHTRVAPNMLRAIMDEAGSFELPVVATLGMTDAVAAAKAGVASIERLSGIAQSASGSPAALFAAYRRGFDRGWTREEKSWSRLRRGSIDRVAHTLAASGVSLTPTLALHEAVANLDDASRTPRPPAGVVPAEIAAEWDGRAIMRERGWTAADLRAFRQGRAAQDHFVVTYHSFGGRLGVGTSSPGPWLIPGQSLHRELALLVAAGLSPMEAIVRATSGNAAILQADSLGIIAPGKSADLVILTANPLADIHNSESIENVMVRGNLLLVETITSRW